MSKMAMVETELQGNQLLPHLPEEIIQNILSRVPVQSLVRFSCTCKRWRSLIFTDSKFNKAHIRQTNRPSWKLIPVIHSETTIDCDCNVSTTPHPNTLMTKISYLRNSTLLGSCNGILFIIGYGTSNSNTLNQLILWNPYINSIKWINGGETFPDHGCMYGLTYDRATDDYKAIVVVVVSKKECTPYVYSLRKNNYSWKKLSSDLSTVNISETIQHRGQLGITLDNGICYWKVELKLGKSGIICFDSAEFKDVPLPDMLCRSTGRLGSLDGCLSLIQVCSVWVMKDYGCWTKLFDLGLSYVGRNFNTTYKPVGYSWSKDEVVVKEGDVNFGRFMIADVRTGFVRRPSGFSSIDESRNVNIYTESLMCPWLGL